LIKRWCVIVIDDNDDDDDDVMKVQLDYIEKKTAPSIHKAAVKVLYVRKLKSLLNA